MFITILINHLSLII